MKKKAVLSLSGGMDSSTLLIHLLSKGYEVTALTFDYGQKHSIEIEKAKQLTKYLSDKNVMDSSSHRVVPIPLQDLLHSTLVKGGGEVPEGGYSEEQMKDTVVPNRNKIFSSIIQAAALSIANEEKCDVDIAMGIHAGDHSIYPDCRQEFRDLDYQAFLAGNWDADKVKYSTPLININKSGILEIGETACESLGIDFDEFYSNTFTSYKPIVIDGEYYSDFKSGSSIERIEAFHEVGKKDPIKYSDGKKEVDWETVVSHMITTLKKDH